VDTKTAKLFCSLKWNVSGCRLVASADIDLVVIHHLYINLRVISHVYGQSGRSVKPKFFSNSFKN